MKVDKASDSTKTKRIMFDAGMKQEEVCVCVCVGGGGGGGKGDVSYIEVKYPTLLYNCCLP